MVMIPSLVNQLADCDLILYQAGADSHIDDPLGGFLTTEQIKQRDAIVFREAKCWDIPLVWNLAGGYQIDALPNRTNSIKKVLVLHDKGSHKLKSRIPNLGLTQPFFSLSVRPAVSIMVNWTSSIVI